MTRASELFGGGGGGIHFKDPWEFMPYTAAVADLLMYDSGSASRAASTTNFFTELARRGLQNQTDWVADTYKTLLNVASGKGLVAAIIGPTMGGAETTTFRITVDGVADEIAITGASGKRACLLTKNNSNVDFTTANTFVLTDAEALAADKATFANMYAAGGFIPGWRQMSAFPMLRFKQSLLIEAKNSADITNSTATAYSGVMYRLGL